MPNSYSFFPAYDHPSPRERIMPNWKLDGVTVVEDDSSDDGTFDPSGHTAAEVKEYVQANPGERAAVLAAESDGKNRVTLTEWLAADGS